MTLAEVVLAVMWLAVTAYALFGGADFGGGLWDLFAGGARRGSAQRGLIERVIGPVWEANHVWLIFVVVILWTAVPEVFAAVASTLYIPLTAVALGIILRGSGFAFRKAVNELAHKRLFGVAFASSSIVTPFFLGTVAGAVASGRVPLGNAAGDPWTSWLNPTSVLGGVLAVAVCAFLAAVFLAGDAVREGDERLAAAFRIRGLWAGVLTGAIALSGIAVLRADAPMLFAGLTGRAAPLIVASAVGGAGTLVLVARRRHGVARVTAGLAVAAVVWGWAVGQYPYLLEGTVTIEQAAAGRAVLQALLGSIAAGALLVIPSLVWLYVLFQRHPGPADHQTPQLPSPDDGR